MVTIYQTIVAMVVLQIYVSAAPSNTPNLEEVTKIEKEKPNLDTSPPSSSEESKGKKNSTENQRHKRFYNHYGLGFPPISPLQYPTYNKRDQASELGVYGIDDPLSQIHRRLQDIASIVRQPPPPQPHFPIYFPVLFIPQFGCACNPASDTTPQVTTKPDTGRPTAKPPVDGSTNSPDIVNRWPDMDDERQNWGLVVNETEDDYDDGQDFSRPISFDPILPSSATSRPAPPVEHGSSQGGAQTGGQSTTTVIPRPSNDIPRAPSQGGAQTGGQSTTTVKPRPSNDIPREPSDGLSRPPAMAAGAGSVQAAQSPYPPSSAESPREAPTACDGAVLSCCHQPQVTYDCFSILGCPDPTSYGNPCDPLVILRVIGKYQKFYGVRNG